MHTSYFYFSMSRTRSFFSLLIETSCLLKNFLVFLCFLCSNVCDIFVLWNHFCHSFPGKILFLLSLSLFLSHALMNSFPSSLMFSLVNSAFLYSTLFSVLCILRRSPYAFHYFLISIH